MNQSVPSDTDRAVQGSETPRVESPNSTALDQWRGLALVFVLISHGFFFTNRVNGFGRVGVNLFFFISGILVFRSLAKKREQSQFERSVGFWKSRLRRLYPAMLGYVIAMAPVVFVMQSHERSLPLPDFVDYLRAAPWALGYIMNYAPGMPMALGHLWSVSCEMQFYLLAPLIFLAGGAGQWRRNLVWGGLLAALTTSAIIGMAHPMVNEASKYHFEFAVWPMMLGFFCEHKKLLIANIPKRLIQFGVPVAIALFGMASAAMICTGHLKNVVIALGAVMFVPCFNSYLNARCLKGPLGSFFAWIGARTYSIYLWQEPFTICRYLPNLLHPAGALVSILVGGVWFRWFERPFLSAKRRQL
jgi:peptidoglycan/LPS O-acetylase OafA/YrhL